MRKAKGIQRPKLNVIFTVRKFDLKGTYTKSTLLDLHLTFDIYSLLVLHRFYSFWVVSVQSSLPYYVSCLLCSVFAVELLNRLMDLRHRFCNCGFFCSYLLENAGEKKSIGKLTNKHLDAQ